MSAVLTASLARGAELTADSWADFVARLHHDCKGEGVNRHYTADAVFLVEKRVKVWTPEGCDGESFEVYCDGESCSPGDLYKFLDGDDQQRLDAECPGVGFLAASMRDQMDAVGEVCPRRSVHEFNWRWQFVNQHMTRDAADAFIKRKAHDYRDGLRVFVDASTYSWELNTLKAAILDGRIGLMGSEVSA